MRWIKACNRPVSRMKVNKIKDLHYVWLKVGFISTCNTLVCSVIYLLKIQNNEHSVGICNILLMRSNIYIIFIIDHIYVQFDIVLFEHFKEGNGPTTDNPHPILTDPYTSSIKNKVPFNRSIRSRIILYCLQFQYKSVLAHTVSFHLVKISQCSVIIIAKLHRIVVNIKTS